MLTIKAEGSPGGSLRDEMLPEMAALARTTNCCVEVQANETTFWAYPDDSIESLKDAFDRLYITSRFVSVGLRKPVPRKPET